MKKETASANIRVYPSSKETLKILAARQEAAAPGNVTPADIVRDLIAVNAQLYTPRVHKKKGAKNDK